MTSFANYDSWKAGSQTTVAEETRSRMFAERAESERDVAVDYAPFIHQSYGDFCKSFGPCFTPEAEATGYFRRAYAKYLES